jgi:hypothetical protein
MQNIQKLFKSLSEDPRIFISYYDGINDVMFDNFIYLNRTKDGREFFNLSRSGNLLETNLFRRATKKQYIDMLNKYVIAVMPFLERNNMLNKCVFFTIALKKYCSEVYADQLLLEHMKKLNFPVKVKDEIKKLYYDREDSE